MELSNGSTKNIISNPEALRSQAIIIHDTISIIMPLALKCAVDLRIPDHIHVYGLPMPLQDLARAIPVPPSKDPMLRRLMRLLVTKGYFEEPVEDTYRLTPLSCNLLETETGMAGWVSFLNETGTKAMFLFSEWFKVEGSSAFEMATGGKTMWETMSEIPQMNHMYNEAMASRSKQMVRSVVQQYPELFHGAKTLVDVGGGNGVTATIIAETFPKLRCQVFDLPHVIATSPENKMYEKVAGNMFEAIPPADLIILQCVLHDWSDEDCVKILNRRKEAISKNGAGGKIIIMDVVVNSEADVPKAAETSLLFDLTMMILHNGKERDEQEWKNIFHQVGFSQYNIYPTFGVGSIIELHP